MKKLTQKAFLAMLVMLIGLVNTATAQTIFDGTTADGQVIGECLNPEGKTQCSNVECANPEFSDDVRCLSESQVGTELAGGSLDSTGIPTNDSVADLAIKFINFALPYVALAAFLAFIVAAIFYIANFGNEELTQKSRKIMIGAAAGLLIVIGSYAVVQFLTVGLLGRL